MSTKTLQAAREYIEGCKTSAVRAYLERYRSGL